MPKWAFRRSKERQFLLIYPVLLMKKSGATKHAVIEKDEDNSSFDEELNEVDGKELNEEEYDEENSNEEEMSENSEQEEEELKDNDESSVINANELSEEEDVNSQDGDANSQDREEMEDAESSEIDGNELSEESEKELNEEEDSNDNAKELSEESEEEIVAKYDVTETTTKDNTSKYNEKELAKFITSNTAEVNSIITDLSSKLPEVAEQIKKVRAAIDALPENVDLGVSLFDLKSEFLLSYNELLFVYMLMKCDGIDLQNHPLFESLVRSRSLLEKLEPLELKMKAEIENVLNPTTVAGTSNPLSFHANLDDLESESEEESEEEEKKKPQIYVPPKIAAVPYSDKDAERDEAKREQLQERISNNLMIQDIRKEMSNRPEVVRHNTTGDLKLDREMSERTKFEEDNFVRTQVPRKERKRIEEARRRMQRGERIDEIGDFNELDHILKSVDNMKKVVIDEDEFGNRFKRVNDKTGPVAKNKRRRRGGKH